MSSWVKKGDKATESFLERILRCFHNARRPMFLGELAIELILPLSITQDLLLILVENGSLRKAELHELTALDAVEDASVYALVKKSEARLAYRP